MFLVWCFENVWNRSKELRDERDSVRRMDREVLGIKLAEEIARMKLAADRGEPVEQPIERRPLRAPRSRKGGEQP